MLCFNLFYFIWNTNKNSAQDIWIKLKAVPYFLWEDRMFVERLLCAKPYSELHGTEALD
jgi:hypothetical protein